MPVFPLGQATVDAELLHIVFLKEGGHDVPEDKIRERFVRNPALIREAVLLSDRASASSDGARGQSGLNPHQRHFRQGCAAFPWQAQNIMLGVEEVYGAN